MKFGHDYLQTLQNEGFPTEWVHSAISYRQLKKCIKKVRSELLALGLSRDVLSQLCRIDGENDGGAERNKAIAGFEYSFLRRSDSSFLPKLTLILDADDGSPVDAFLSPETRRYLQGLSLLPPTPLDAEAFGASATEMPPKDNAEPPKESTESPTQRNVRAVEVPLTSDDEFFHTLRSSLEALQDLQEREQSALDLRVRSLREDIAKVSNPSFRRTQSTLYAWREIFRLYIDMQIFFSTDEVRSGQRTPAVAQRQLEKFQATLQDKRLVRRLKRDGRVALESFLHINAVLLQNLKFQEVNRLAVSKILKKFDKQTALRARDSLPRSVAGDSLLSRDIAKAICQSISDDLLTVVPQLSDYLCPICLNVAFKPVRLRCNHVFCIRCLVVMQRRRQNHCPLCRGEVVMEATSSNLDQKLLTFLSQAFPKETRAKQKENERAATMELYGETYDACIVM